jgi:hypothetical protein
MTDNNLNSLADNLYYFTLDKYLQFAIAEFRKVCYQDIDTVTSFEQEIYNETGDGGTTDFVLSPAPPTGALFYVSIDGIETTAYTFTVGTNTLTFTSAPALNAVIYIGAYIIGAFTVDLNVDEQRILAEGLTIPFSEGQINKTKAMNQIVYGKGSGIHSQANHNKINLEIKNSQYQRLHQMISEYSYSNDEDDLEGLAAVSTLGGGAT